MSFPCGLRGTNHSHFYLYLKFVLYHTNQIVEHITVHYCLFYEQLTLSLSVLRISRLQKSNLIFISNVLHAYMQYNNSNCYNVKFYDALHLDQI